MYLSFVKRKGISMWILLVSYCYYREYMIGMMFCYVIEYEWLKNWWIIYYLGRIMYWSRVFWILLVDNYFKLSLINKDIVKSLKM